MRRGFMTKPWPKAHKVFNATFGSVFRPGPSHDEQPPHIFEDMYHNELNTVVFTPDVIEKKLLSLKSHSAPGPDGIHPRILKSCASSLKEPLSFVFEESMRSGRLPQDWKCTNITPIFKGGRKTAATNYKPINLCSVIAKTMESIVKDEIIRHLTENELILPSQHGFLLL